MTYHAKCEFEERRTQFLTAKAANVASTEPTNARTEWYAQPKSSDQGPEGSGITGVILETQICITYQNFKALSQHLVLIYRYID